MDCDVAVVGSGHNGLVAGAYLAKWGYRVEVLERRDTIGGAVCTEDKFGGFQMDVGGSVHFLIHHTPIVQDLELEKYGLEYIELDPFMTAPFDDGTSIRFYRDIDKTCESIAAISQHDAEAYRRFIERWQPLNRAVFEFFQLPPTTSNLGRHVLLPRFHPKGSSRVEMVRQLLQSYGRVLDDAFESPKLKAALAWWGAQSGPPPTDTASAEFVGWHSVIHSVGPARPRGGSGMLTQALARYIQDHGGRVRTSSEVTRILTEGNRAVGVETAAGTLTARRVISNAHVWVTFQRLLADWTPPELRRRVGSIRVGNGFGMVIRCAMNELPRYAVHDAANEEILRGMQLLCPSTDYLNASYGDYLKGRPSEEPAAIAMPFSAVDPSLAPAGKHVLFVWGQYYPYRLRDGTSWPERAEREAEKLLGVVERFAPGTKRALRDWYIQTPAEIEEKHNMPNANVMHVEMTLDQMFTFRPLPELAQYKTPLEHLYMANAGMHPGGGIFGAAGYNCAHAVRTGLRFRRR
jgi:phytoene dehydrogenase-like protein